MKKKKDEVFKTMKLLFDGQKLIYTDFIDGIFGKNLAMNRSGSDYSDYSDDDDDDDDDDKFYTPKETPQDIMPELESKESAAQRRNQRAQELKILTPEQMLSKLPIYLAQPKAGNNSEKLKKIRQLLYFLDRSKR